MKWTFFITLLVIVNVTLSLAATKKKKNEEESKENSIHYYYNELMHRPGSLITSMLHDATLPVFLVMGIASIASVLTNVSCLFLTLSLSLPPSCTLSICSTSHSQQCLLSFTLPFPPPPPAPLLDSLVKTKALMEFTGAINDHHHLHQLVGLKTS